LLKLSHLAGPWGDFGVEAQRKYRLLGMRFKINTRRMRWLDRLRACD